MRILTPVFLILLASCDDPDERYDVGYDDGYASGYNTECRIRATLIEGDFDNADYSRGYYDGSTPASKIAARVLSTSSPPPASRPQK